MPKWQASPTTVTSPGGESKWLAKDATLHKHDFVQLNCVLYHTLLYSNHSIIRKTLCHHVCFLFGQLNFQCTLVTRISLHPLALVPVQSHAPTICIVSHMKYRWIDRTTLSYGPMGVMSSQARRSKTGGPRKKCVGSNSQKLDWGLLDSTSTSFQFEFQFIIQW